MNALTLASADIARCTTAQSTTRANHNILTTLVARLFLNSGVVFFQSSCTAKNTERLDLWRKYRWL